MENKTLFERLGRAQGISALVEDIVDAHMSNSTIGARFLPYKDDPERLAKIKGHLCTFLEAGSGGPRDYSGRDMVAAHRGMNISAAEYMAAIDDIMGVLVKHKVDEQTQKDILAITYSLRAEIMHV